MATEEKTAARGIIATVVATAAVTLALGITGAALGGYLAPASDGDRAGPKQAIETNAVSPQRAASPSDARVVFVPIAPDTPTAPAASEQAESSDVLFAAYEPAEGQDRDHDKHHSKRRDKHHDKHHGDHGDRHDDD